MSRTEADRWIPLPLWMLMYVRKQLSWQGCFADVNRWQRRDATIRWRTRTDDTNKTEKQRHNIGNKRCRWRWRQWQKPFNDGDDSGRRPETTNDLQWRMMVILRLSKGQGQQTTDDDNKNDDNNKMSFIPDRAPKNIIVLMINIQAAHSSQIKIKPPTSAAYHQPIALQRTIIFSSGLHFLSHCKVTARIAHERFFANTVP